MRERERGQSKRALTLSVPSRASSSTGRGNDAIKCPPSTSVSVTPLSASLSISRSNSQQRIARRKQSSEVLEVFPVRVHNATQSRKASRAILSITQSQKGGGTGGVEGQSKGDSGTGSASTSSDGDKEEVYEIDTDDDVAIMIADRLSIHDQHYDQHHSQNHDRDRKTEIKMEVDERYRTATHVSINFGVSVGAGVVTCERAKDSSTNTRRSSDPKTTGAIEFTIHYVHAPDFSPLTLPSSHLISSDFTSSDLLLSHLINVVCCEHVGMEFINVVCCEHVGMESPCLPLSVVTTNSPASASIGSKSPASRRKACSRYVTSL